MEIGAEWLNSNEFRRYPIAANVTNKDNSGKLLPDSLIADMMVVYNDAVPSSAGPYLSSLVIGPSIVSIAVSIDEGVILSASFSRPVPAKVALPFKASNVNASGYIAFGVDINEEQNSYIFSSAAQSRLEYKATKRFSALPIKSFGVQGRPETLDGIVKLSGTDPIVIEHVGNNVVEITIKESERQKFLGPCDNGLSLDSCGAAPIRKINNVGPDEFGTIYIEVE